MEKVVIIGSGCAGLTSAIYTARANLEPLVLTGAMPGGLLTTTSIVENFPGFSNGIDGTNLMIEMQQQAERFGAKIQFGSTVESVDFSGQSLKLTVDGKEVETQTVIIASGAGHRHLGLSSEAKLERKGVTYCATCDGALPALFWMAVSCGFSAYGFIQIRRLEKVHPFSIVAWISVVSAPALLGTSMIFESNHLEVIQASTWSGWLALCYTAIVGSVIANSGLYFLLERYPVNLVTPFSLLSPIFAVIGGILFLDDVLTVGLMIGGGLILCGVTWINRRAAVLTRKPNSNQTG